MTFKKKGFIQTAMTVALAFTIANCAWAGFDDSNNKLAYSSNGLSAWDDSESESLYLDDGESYIIDANSPEAVSVPSTTRLTGNIQIADDTELVTLSLRDADVKQVLRVFADKAKMNIVFHNSVSGEVTLDLKDVPVNTALEFVLDACQLTYVRQDNNMIVASKDAAKDLSYARQNFTTIPVKYVNAQMVANFLNKSMFNGKYQGVSAVPNVAVNATKNELMIFGTDEDEKLVRKLLTKLDTKPMMNVFRVNHVTPAEMAATICDTILADKSKGSSDGVSIQGQRQTGSSNENEITLGGGYTVCVVGQTTSGTVDDSSGSDDFANYASNPLTVAYFPELGTVTTYGGSREQVKMIESFIKLHDKKQPMAYIEFSLIQLSEEGSKAFNTEWSMWTPVGEFNFGQGGLYTNPWAPTFFKGGHKDVYSQSTPDVQYTIQKPHGWGPIVMSLNYLLQNGKGRTLANPKVMVTNGKTSTIDLTSDYVKKVTQEYTGQQYTAVTRKTYEIGSDQGIKIEVTPFISPDGYVVLNLKPDYTEIRERQEDYTLLSRRNLELENIRVKDGETLVLAGMVREAETNSTTKLPVLGDLPVIGAFFRNSSSNLDREEYIILVTPHIVYSKEQVDRLKAQQNNL